MAAISDQLCATFFPGEFLIGSRAASRVFRSSSTVPLPPRWASGCITSWSHAKRHERSPAAGIHRHVGDGLNFVRIQLGQRIGQAQAILQFPPALSIETPIQFTLRSRARRQ